MLDIYSCLSGQVCMPKADKCAWLTGQVCMPEDAGGSLPARSHSSRQKRTFIHASFGEVEVIGRGEHHVEHLAADDHRSAAFPAFAVVVVDGSLNANPAIVSK